MGFYFEEKENDPCKCCYQVPCEQCSYGYKEKEEQIKLYDEWKRHLINDKICTENEVWINHNI